MLATSPSRVRNMDEGLCTTFWHLEFHEQDTALFTDLARGDGAAGLRLALDDRAARSIRYRECLQPQGYDDELRALFRSGDACWGAVGLYRENGRPAFDEHDVAVVQSISSTVAEALRTHVRRAVPWLEASSPGLLVVDRSGRILSANSEALTWLRLLWPMSPLDGARDGRPVELAQLGDRSIGLPTPLFSLVAMAHAVAEGRERGPARLRLRDASGRWVVLHATLMTGAERDAGVAVVIENARPADVAPLLLDAYSLTPRERQVLAALARGAGTGEIATELRRS